MSMSANGDSVPGQDSGKALPWSVSLSEKINRRRFMRRTADGMFLGVMGVALGQMKVGKFIKSIPNMPNIPSDCESPTGCGCPTCCGPDRCCASSCCSQDCCSGGQGHSQCNSSCGYYGDWGGGSCWSHETSVGNCTLLTVCCDCHSSCGSNRLCICWSNAKFCPGQPGWSLWDPATGTWLPPVENPFAGIG
jgi:hypothetical protein